jgi:recombination protein RecT
MEQQKGLVAIHNTIEQMIDQKIQAMPKDFNKTRFIQNAMTVLQENKDKIESLDPKTVARTILKGAFLGLDFFQKEAYAIPFGNKLEFIVDYKGKKKLAKKYSIRPIMDIYAKVVRDGDIFDELIMNGQQSINFKPLSFNDGDIKGAFAVVLYIDGGMQYETMSKKDIENVRDKYSKQAKGQAWSHSFDEMCKKTVLGRLCKHIELDFENIDQAKTFEESADVEFKKKKEVVKATSSLDALYEDDDSEVIDVTPEEPTQEDIE